ncbi:MAG: hypothetical protein ABEJ67_02815 [Halanaeroarchaeum sp.]
MEPTGRIWQLQSFVDQVTRSDVPRERFSVTIVALAAFLVWLETTGLAIHWLTHTQLLASGLALVLVGAVADLGFTVWHRRKRLSCPS